LRIVKPAVITAAQPLLLDAAAFEETCRFLQQRVSTRDSWIRILAMRAMRVECADPPLLVAEHDNVLAQKLFFPREIAQLALGPA
jgi:hypothetical protein